MVKSMAARTLEEMAAKGYAKATAKAEYISTAWEKAKERMIKHYKALPFGPTRKTNYERAIRAAKHRQDWDKWRDNWIEKMKE